MDKNKCPILIFKKLFVNFCCFIPKEERKEMLIWCSKHNTSYTGLLLYIVTFYSIKLKIGYGGGEIT